MRTTTIALLVLLPAACAAPAGTQRPCPATVGGYAVGEATTDFVKECLGKPMAEERNAKGGMTYFYKVNKDTTGAFVFDKSGRLLHTEGYREDH